MSSPWAVMFSWQESFIRQKTYNKPSDLGQTDLVFGLSSEFISRSVHAGLQVSLCSSYMLVNTQIHNETDSF